MSGRVVDDVFEGLDEGRQFFDDGPPEDVQVDVEVVVDQSVAHPGGIGPRNLRVLPSVTSLTCLAASPTISTSFVRPRRSSSSVWRSPRLRC